MSEIDFKERIKKWLSIRQIVIYETEPKDGEDVIYLKGKIDMCTELLDNLVEI